MKATLLGTAASPFAHLLGRRAAALDAKKAEEKDDDKDAKAKTESEGDDEDDKKKPDEKDSKKTESSDDDDEDKKDTKKSKAKSKAEQDDDDETDASSKAIRHRERARCAAIFADPAAAKRPDVAAQLAFGTPLNRDMAISTLRAVAGGEPDAPDAQGAGLSSRMRTVPDPDLGNDAEKNAEADPAKVTAQGIINAGKLRRGEKIT